MADDACDARLACLIGLVVESSLATPLEGTHPDSPALAPGLGVRRMSDCRVRHTQVRRRRGTPSGERGMETLAARLRLFHCKRDEQDEGPFLASTKRVAA